MPAGGLSNCFEARKLTAIKMAKTTTTATATTTIQYQTTTLNAMHALE